MSRAVGGYLRRNHVALLALFVALGGTSYAASSVLLPRNSVGSPQVIDGSLQRADLSRKAQTLLRGATGEAGAPGPQGAQGPQGVQGPQGAQGPQGVQGSTGPAGSPGAEGPQGVKGDLGPEGPGFATFSKNIDTGAEFRIPTANSELDLKATCNAPDSVALNFNDSSAEFSVIYGWISTDVAPAPRVLRQIVSQNFPSYVGKSLILHVIGRSTGIRPGKPAAQYAVVDVQAQVLPFAVGDTCAVMGSVASSTNFATGGYG